MPTPERAEFERLVRAGVTPRVAATIALEQRDRRRGPGRPALAREHGTNRGYHQHRSRGEDACAPCLDAHAACFNLSDRRLRQVHATRVAA
ncbi:hypothetical protein DQ240_18390 [Blastococcus sp. TF02A-26]|nr:hypothetical protein DQ240_18390 [Blastococcus sp. TF02A-26]